jgi:integrase
MARDKRLYGTIRKLPSGRYQALYTNTAGKRMTAPHTFRARIDAEGYLHERRRETEMGRYNPGAVVRRDRVTFGDYATTWLRNRHVSGRPIKPRTREHYQSILDDHLLPTFSDKLIAAITPKDVRTWHSSTLVNRPTMRSHSYSLLRSIMAGAVNDDLIAANPVHIVGAGSAKRAIKIRPASVEELAVVTAAMPDRLQLMVLLASWCAMRFGELIELRRGDIDVGAELIRIRRAAVRVDGKFEIGEPKSEAGTRDVDIPPHLIPVIEQHLANHVGVKAGSLLFPNDLGEHLQPSTLMRHWYKARVKAGRDDLRWHDLRHSGAVFAALTGATLAELMSRLGHSTPRAALHYQHVAQGRGREIAALLSKMAAASTD